MNEKRVVSKNTFKRAWNEICILCYSGVARVTLWINSMPGVYLESMIGLSRPLHLEIQQYQYPGLNFLALLHHVVIVNKMKSK